MTTMNAMNVNHNSHAAPPAALDRPAKRSVWAITEKTNPDGTRAFWTKVGVAFENRDGSVTLKLDALPLSGTLQIRDDQVDATRRDRAASAPF